MPDGAIIHHLFLDVCGSSLFGEPMKKLLNYQAAAQHQCIK